MLSNNNTNLKPNSHEIRKTLKTLGIGKNQITELRVLNAKEKNNSVYQFVFGGYFDDIELLIKAACSIDYASGWYIVPNPCNQDLLSRFCNRAVRLPKGEGTKDTEIASRKWFLVDVDPVRIRGISSTDDEHQLALSRALEVEAHLRSKNWPKPIIADSGNGAHLMYRVDLPTNDNGIIEHCLKALDKRFSDNKVKIDTSVYNPARIWKLYGTPACKGDNTPTRPHRMAKLLEVPDDL